jgi:hypothetical protein
MGMGLSICKIDRRGPWRQRIAVESRARASGAMFRVILPAV